MITHIILLMGLTILTFAIGLWSFWEYAHGDNSGWWSVMFFTLCFICMMALAYSIRLENDKYKETKKQYYKLEYFYIKNDTTNTFVKDSVYVKINKEDLGISK